MSTDDFQDVARVVAQSGVARTIGGGIDALREAAHSFWARRCERLSRRVGSMAPVARVRLLGVLLLTATVTHQLLLAFVPAFLRPAATRWLAVEGAVPALILIGAAPLLERAWPGSRLRRILGLGRD